MEGKKRKREGDHGQRARITYHAGDRTFERLFKEGSLEETKALVRRKLHLAPDTIIHLAQLREGRVIDLDDDEDFDAFEYLAESVLSLDVRVTVVGSLSDSAHGEHRKTQNYRPLFNEESFMSQRLVPVPALDWNSLGSNESAQVTPLSGKKRKLEAPPAQVEPHMSSASGSSRKKKRKSTAGVPDAQDTPKLSSMSTIGSANQDVDIPSKITSMLIVEDSSTGAQRHSGRPEGMALPIASYLHAQPSRSGEPSGSFSTSVVGPKKKKRRNSEMIPELARHMAPDATAVDYSPVSSEKAKKDSNKTSKSQPQDIFIPSSNPIESGRIHPSSSGSVPELMAYSEKSSNADPTLASQPTVANPSTDPPVVGPSAESEQRQPSENKETETRISPKLNGDGDDGVPVQAADGESSGAMTVPKARSNKGKSTSNRTIEDESHVVSLSVSAAKPFKKESKSHKASLLSDGSVAPVKKTSRKKKTDPPSETEASTPASDFAVASKGLSTSKLRKGKEKGTSENTTVSDAVQDILKAIRSTKCEPSSSSGPSVTNDGATTATVEQEPVPKTKHVQKGSKRSKLHISWFPDDSPKEASAIPASSDSTIAPQPELLPSTPDSSSTPLSANPSVPPKQRRRSLTGVPCPICHDFPDHLRQQCPIILSGPDAIQKRIDELKGDDAEDHAVLIEELESLVMDHREAVGSREPEANPTSVLPVENFAGIPSSAPSPISKALDARLPSWRPVIPKGSQMSEVTVESKDEGSSNESSDEDEDEDKDGDQTTNSSTSGRPNSYLDLSLYSDGDVSALIRGPATSHSVLADISSSSGSDGEEDRENDILEEADDDNDKKYRRYRRLIKQLREPSSSDEEQSAQLSKDTEDDEAPQSSDHQGRYPAAASAHGSSFQDPEDLSESAEIDHTANLASSDAFASDNALIAEALKDPGEELMVVHEKSGESDDDQTEVPTSAPGDETDLSLSWIGDQGKERQSSSDEVCAGLVAQEGHLDTELHLEAAEDDGALITRGHHEKDSELLAADQQVEDQATQQVPSAGAQDDADPIQPADDLPSVTSDDPIEVEDSTNNSLAISPKPGIVRRMRNRSGNVLSTEEERPVPVTDVTDSTTARGPEVQKENEGIARRTRNSMNRSASAAAMPPPSTPAPVPAPPRRTRATAEEKAQKAAAMQAERERKAAVREAEKAKKAQEKAAARQEEKEKKAAARQEEKEKKAAATAAAKQAEKEAKAAAIAAAKQAEKEAKAAEKAAAKEAQKEEKARLRAEKTRAARGASKDSSDTTGPSLLENEEETAPPPATPHPTVTHAQHPPQSLDKWATLESSQVSSPQMVADSSMMIDQLEWSSAGANEDAHSASAVLDPTPEGESSRPEAVGDIHDNVNGVPLADDKSNSGDTAMQTEPLFELSSSQVPFPYSQWNNITEHEENQSSGQTVPRGRSTSSTESESEVERAMMKPPTRSRTQSASAPYRRLTDIASQQLFSQAIVSPAPAVFPLRPVTDRLNDMYGRNGDDDEEEDDSDNSGSDSEVEKASRIPKSRRAGVKPKKGVAVI